MTLDDAGEGRIRIYLRARPSRRASRRANIDHEQKHVEFTIPRDKTAGYVNNQNECHGFSFDGVFDGAATQETVFEEVAADVIAGSLEGYNGTLFAYGQTGSGKTFTITGGPERYIDRGIIPRALSTIFSETAQRSDHVFTIHVSYLEIYNDVVYDLLDPDREIKDIDDLPRVLVREDEEGNLVFSNLRLCKVDNEEDALSLLFLGDTNRAISETPMNMASSRSHCIFTIHIQSRRMGEDTIRRSKLNLVDLAGSERVKKTGIDGVTFVESRHINLSLHFLEQVIVALQENALGTGRSHIPYRNSAMTLMLRDSLGGNCRTVMIANISMEQAQLDESISTCRFAQRVAMISNEAVVNEELDPALVIARLKQEISDLRLEVRILRGDEAESDGVNEEEQRQIFKEELTHYCNSADDQILNLDRSLSLLRFGFEVMKRLVNDSKRALTKKAPQKEPGTPGVEEQPQKKARATHNPPESLSATDSSLNAETRRIEAGMTMEATLHNQEQLRFKFAAAKTEGQRLTDSKKKLSALKSFIEKKRLKRSIAELCHDCDATPDAHVMPDAEEEEATRSLAEEKANYKESFYRLRDLKQEIECLQALLETQRPHKTQTSEPDCALPNRSCEAETYAAQLASGRSIQPETLKQAQEHFTGNPAVDQDILQFYLAKSAIQQHS